MSAVLVTGSGAKGSSGGSSDTTGGCFCLVGFDLRERGLGLSRDSSTEKRLVCISSEEAVIKALVALKNQGIEMIGANIREHGRIVIGWSVWCVKDSQVPWRHGNHT